MQREDLKQILRKIQSMDPPGVGARSLQECLSLQLARKEKIRPEVELARQIIDTAFGEFSRKHYHKLQDRFNLTEAELRNIFDEIAKLNPKPGGALSHSAQNLSLIHI